MFNFYSGINYVNISFDIFTSNLYVEAKTSTLKIRSKCNIGKFTGGE